MKMLKKIILILVVLGSAGVIFLLTSNMDKPAETEVPHELHVALTYASTDNYRQTINDCGPYSAAAVLRILKKEPIDSQVMVEKMKWRLNNDYTLPWGMEQLLKDEGITIETPDFRSLADSERVNALQQYLSKGKPVIILGKVDGYQHYITLVGFDREHNAFYVYDSLHDKESEGMTVDDNGDLPGNRTVGEEALLDFWGGGGIAGLYTWYAIISE